MNARLPSRCAATPWTVRFGLALLMLTTFAPAGKADDAPPARTRVAMMDFAADDGLMRSADGAVQCSLLAQDALSKLAPEIDWIERSQVQTAADELSLSAGGFTSADGSLRIGKWLKADLAILGRFVRNEKNEDGHTLRLEVVDLGCADTLAARTIQVDGDRRDAITADPALASAAAAALREALNEAREKLARTAHQFVVAPLFFHNADPSPRLDGFGSTLKDAFAEAAGRAGDVRVLRFPQADEARGEAELVVNGLSDGDADAWQRVAGLYVWGSYRELPAPGVAFAQTPVEIELTRWDGAGPAVSRREKSTVAELPALARRLAEQCLDAARHAPAHRADDPAVRREIAGSLCEQGRQLANAVASHGTQRAAFLDTPAGRTTAREMRLLLDAACFFAPDDREAQLARLQARWDDFPSPVSRRPLLDLWRRDNDLADFAARFGGGDTDFPLVLAHADAYMIDRLHWGERQVHVSGSEPNLPLDASDANIAAWHAALDGRFARDVEIYARTTAKRPLALNDKKSLFIYVTWMRAALKSMHDPALAGRVVEATWPLYLPLHQQHPADAERLYGETDGGLAADLPSLYERLGKPGRAAALLASLSDGASASPPVLSPDARPADAARPLARLKPASSIFMLGTPAQHSLSDPAATEYVVHQMTVAADDQLWVSIEHASTRLDDPAARTPKQEFWRYDPALQGLSSFAVEGLDARNPITAILPRPGRLWLGVEFRGVADYDTDKEATTRRYTVADGLLSDSVDDITAGGDGRLYVAGHENSRSLLNAFDPARQEWTRVPLPAFPDLPAANPLTTGQNARFTLPPSAQAVAFGRWLLVGAGTRWALTDTKQPQARPLGDVLPVAFRKCFDAPPTTDDAKAKARGAYGGLPPRCPRLCAADAGGYWLAVGRTLLRFDPDHPGASRSFPLPAEYADGLTAIVSDGNEVWTLGMLDPAMIVDQVETAGSRKLRAAWGKPRFPVAFVAVMHAADGHWRGGFELPGSPGCLALSRQTLYVGLQQTPRPLFEIDMDATLGSGPK